MTPPFVANSETSSRKVAFTPERTYTRRDVLDLSHEDATKLRDQLVREFKSSVVTPLQSSKLKAIATTSARVKSSTINDGFRRELVRLPDYLTVARTLI